MKTFDNYDFGYQKLVFLSSTKKTYSDSIFDSNGAKLSCRKRTEGGAETSHWGSSSRYDHAFVQVTSNTFSNHFSEKSYVKK